MIRVVTTGMSNSKGQVKYLYVACNLKFKLKLEFTVVLNISVIRFKVPTFNKFIYTEGLCNVSNNEMC